MSVQVQIADKMISGSHCILGWPLTPNKPRHYFTGQSSEYRFGEPLGNLFQGKVIGYRKSY